MSGACEIRFRHHGREQPRAACTHSKFTLVVHPRQAEARAVCLQAGQSCDRAAAQVAVSGSVTPTRTACRILDTLPNASNRQAGHRRNRPRILHRLGARSLPQTLCTFLSYFCLTTAQAQRRAMQAAKSHPYQTRSMTAAKQDTETHNRGGAASSSGSSTSLAKIRTASSVYSSRQSYLAAADWANIPPNVCQQFLSINSGVYRVGGQVCKNWNEVQRGDSCRVLCVNLRWESEWLDSDEYSSFAAYTVLQQHASKDLQQLIWQDEGTLPEAPISGVDMINQFPNLRHLCLNSVFLEWNLDFATTNLVVLHLEPCCLCFVDRCEFEEQLQHGEPEYPSLAFLNKQQMLQDVRVAVLTDFTKDHHLGSLVVLGDVNLPRLQRLALDAVEGDIVLNELTLKHIPKDCYIDISGFDLFQESAQDRVFQSKLMQTLAYSS